jgi:hypothetical protein
MSKFAASYAVINGFGKFIWGKPTFTIIPVTGTKALPTTWRTIL